MIEAIGTYLPIWEDSKGHRIAGADEDAVTMAVAAGLAAMALAGHVSSVVLVTRDFALLEGGNAPALLGGLGLPRTTDVVERLGGAPAALDALISASPGTLVIAVDNEGSAGAGAAVIGEVGGILQAAGRVHRSLPLRTRWSDGSVFEDDDPRLLRERGLRASIDAADLPSKPTVLPGVVARESASLVVDASIELPTLGASSSVFALAALADSASSGLVVACEQATLSAALWDPWSVSVERDERPPEALPKTRMTLGPDMKVSFAAYDRAFDSKVRWEAARCRSCATLSFPPRYRCLACGSELEVDTEPLPREGKVYSATTVHVPVPSMASPYMLAVVELGQSGVRSLVGVTDTAARSIGIGTSGRLVFRRVALRSGVPDYGYAFCPDAVS